MDKLVKWLENLIRVQKNSRAWRTFVSCLAAIVVFTTTYSLILPAITVEQSATEDVGGLVLDEADPGSTGAEAEATGEVVSVDAENETSNETVQKDVPDADEETDQTTPTGEAPSESKATQSVASRTETVKASENTASVAEEVKEPVNGEVQTIGDKRIMTLTGEDFDVVVSGDLSVGVSDGTVLSVRGIPDADVVKSFSDRISDELLKIFVDTKTTEVLYQLVFTDENLFEYAPTGYFDVQFIFHQNTVSHTGEMIYAAIYDYLTDEMILAEKNGDEYETPVIALDEYGIIKGITLKGMHFDEYSDIITLVAGPVNEELKLAAEKAATGSTSTDSKSGSSTKSAESKTGKTESGKESAESKATKTDSAESKSEGPSAKAGTSKGSETAGSGTLTSRGSDYTVTLAYGADAKIPANAKLAVSEIENGTKEYKKYLKQAKAAMGLDEDQELLKEQARFFDIKIMTDGKEVQPAANVNVNISYDQPAVETDPRTGKQFDASAVHFGKKGAEVVEVGEADANCVEFKAENFSVYGIIYTVDFTYENYTYHMDGGGFILLSELFEGLGIQISVESVVSIEFSNNSVMRIESKGGDWLLTSLAPFHTQETLRVITKDGVVLEIYLTDAELSNDLEKFVTDVSFTKTDGSTVAEEGGMLIVNNEDSYLLTLHFAESDAYQMIPTGILEYTLPEEMNLTKNESGTFSMRIGNRSVNGNTYTYNAATGKITVQFNQDDPNFRYLERSTSLWFDLDFEVKVNTGLWDFQFGDDNTTELHIKSEEKHNVKAEKTGEYDADNHRMVYTVTITPTKGKSENVSVMDAVSGRALSYNNDAHIVSPSGTAYTVNSATSGFDWTISEVQEGQPVVIQYTADVIYENIAKSGQATVTETGNSVIVSAPGDDDENDNEDSHDESNIPFSSLTKVSTGTSDIVTVTDDNGNVTEKYRLVTWQIRANTERLVSLYESGIIDTNKTNDKMDYYGQGVSVEVTDESGNTTSRLVPWSELGVSDTASAGSWTYTVTESGKNSYVFTYQTKVRIDNQSNDFTVENGAATKYNNDDTKVPIEVEKEVVPENKTVVSKYATKVSAESITWKISINVPEEGVEGYTLNDILPTKGGYYDSFDSYTVDGLLEGSHENVSPTPLTETHYSDGVPYEVQTGVKFTFTYTDEHEQTIYGLAPNTGNGNRTITIIVVTENNQDWLDAVATGGDGAGWLASHENIAQGYVNGVPDGKDSDSQQPAKPTIEKTTSGSSLISYFGTKDDWNTKYELPLYQFTLTLKGVTYENFDIEETFNTNYFEYLDITDVMLTNPGNYSGEQGKIRYSTDPWQYQDSTFKITSTPSNTGATFHVGSLPKDANGNYYGYYRISYYLVVKDKSAYDALKKLTAESGEVVTDSNGNAVSKKYVFENAVVWDKVPSESEFEYTIENVMSKTASGVDADGYVTYTITLNPKKEKLNDGVNFDLSDVFTGQEVKKDTISITGDPALQNGWEFSDDISGSEEYEGVILTLSQTSGAGGTITAAEIPDETKVVITYKAKPNATINTETGKVDVDYSNTASFLDYNYKIEKNQSFDFLTKDQGTKNSNGKIPYTITLNPQKMKVNGGEDYTLTDTIDGLELEENPFTIVTDPNCEINWSLSDDGKTYTFTVPDETSVKITYEGKPIYSFAEGSSNNSGELEASFTNTAESQNVTKTTEGEDTTQIIEKNHAEYDPDTGTITFTVVFNPTRMKLNGGKDIELTDTYEGMSVDYSSIDITLDPNPDGRIVAYDFSGNEGTFIVPDETQVTLTYRGKLVFDENKISNWSNTVKAAGYTDEESGEVHDESHGEGGGELGNQIYLKKYEYGHMERGINGVTFALYKADWSGPITEDALNAGKVPVLDGDGNQITYTTQHVEGMGDGYVEVYLTQQEHGVNGLESNTLYFLKETSHSDEYISEDIFWNFVITLQSDYTAANNVYYFHNEDILKVNNKKPGKLVLKKTFGEDSVLTADNMTDEQKAIISFNVFDWNHHLVTSVTYDQFTNGSYSVTEGIIANYSYTVEEISTLPGFEVTTTYSVNGEEASEECAEINAGYTTDTDDEAATVEVNNTYKREVGIEIQKVNDSGQNLGGAVFNLTYSTDKPNGSNPAVNAQNVKVIDSEGNQTELTNGNVTVPKEGITLSGLVPGYYLLKEISPPEDYVLEQPINIYFRVDGGSVAYYTDGTYSEETTAQTNVAFVKNDETGSGTFTVTNISGVALPETGGPGTNLFYGMGITFIAMAGLLFFIKKKSIRSIADFSERRW